MPNEQSLDALSKETPAPTITIGMELARPIPRPTVKGIKVLNLRADDPEGHPSFLKQRSMRLLSLGWGLQRTSRHVGVSIEQLREWRDAKPK